MQPVTRLDWSMRILATLLVLAIWAGTAGAATPTRGDDLVNATLLADVASVKPGDEFTLGILLKIEPKWHVYWKYPGDAGLPTRVQWTLPDASAPQPPLLFPLPVRFDQPGDVVGYGYKDEVMLLARVTAPANAATGSTLNYAADVSWLVCEVLCLPGSATVNLSIPLSAETTPANTELFQKWSARLPESADRDTAAAPLKSTDLQRLGDGELQAKVTWPTDRPLKDVDWFPLPPKRVGVEDAQTKADADGSTFSFALIPMPKENVEMRFLVTYTDSDGKRRGVEFTENLPPPLPR